MIRCNNCKIIYDDKDHGGFDAKGYPLCKNAREGKVSKRGRPQTFDVKATMDVICGCIAQGKSLVQILQAEGMPSYASVMRWMDEHPELHEKYARARADAADYLADEIVMIADTEPDPQVARVRVDARKWVASKLKPKKYGDRIQQDITATLKVEEMSDEELISLTE